MKYRLLLLLVTFLFNSLPAFAQSWLWGEQSSPGIKVDVLQKNVAVDRNGNVYQVGIFETTITFGSYTLTSQSDMIDVFLVKYDPNGNVLWAKGSESESGFAFGSSVATDDSGNAYITGTTGTNTSFGNYTLDQDNEAFIVKYDPNGNVVWAKQPNFNSIWGISVATDKYGHEYLTGYSSYLVKYDNNGNVIWDIPPQKTSTGTEGQSVTTDIDGNVFIAGQIRDSLILGNYKFYSPNLGIYIAKFDSNGNVLWAMQSTNTLLNRKAFNTSNGGFSVATDKSGAVYLTGAFSADSLTFGTHTFHSVNDSTYNFLLIKFSPDGNIIWGKEVDPIKDSIDGWGSYFVCTDDSYHIYISGAEARVHWLTSSDDSFIFSSDTINVPGIKDGFPAFLLKLDSSGNVICSSTLPAGGYYPDAVATDSSGKYIYLGGGFNLQLIIDKDTLNDKTGQEDTYVARWKPCFECELVVTIAPQSPTLCDGQSIELVAGGGTKYGWSPSIGLSATTGSIVVATPLVTTTYSVTSASGGCSDTNEFVLTVEPTPVVAVSPTSICSGQSVVLNASGALTYQWSPSTGLSSTTGDSVVASITANTTYTIIGTINDCADTVQTTLSVIAAPNKPTITVSVTGDTLFSSATTDNQWNFDGTAINGATDSILIIKGHAKGWYSVTVTNEANGCSTTSDSTTSINQLSVISEQLSIYPNPFSNNVIVKINSAASVNDWSLQVIDVLGRTLYSLPALNYSNEIDLTDLASGVYFIAVVNKTGRAVFKVVKEN